ncbi:MAG: pentapeptide repeat-containing protein [Verrucomicrobia bacterium]|nr:pentapeptide repeat-containing protein [Verrucomicrobiota bacterium]
MSPPVSGGRGSRDRAASYQNPLYPSSLACAAGSVASRNELLEHRLITCSACPRRHHPAGADLRGAHFERAVLDGANLQGAKVSNPYELKDVIGDCKGTPSVSPQDD